MINVNVNVISNERQFGGGNYFFKSLSAYKNYRIVYYVNSTYLKDVIDFGRFEEIVVLSSDLLWVFCLPNSTESEKNFYVIRDRKVLESVQKY